MTAARIAAQTSTPIPLPAGRLAIRDGATVLPGMIPFGILLGVTISHTGGDPLAGLAGAIAIYGGSAQLTAVTLLDRGIAPLLVLFTAAIVNLRLVLYGAAIGHRFRNQPRLFRWLAPHLIIDQTYLMASSRPELTGRHFRSYWWTLGGAVLLVWTASIAIGLVAADSLPELPHLTLVGTALFLGLLVPRLTSRPAVIAALSGGAVAALTAQAVPALGILAGAGAGMSAALAAAGKQERHD